jgi:sortase A
VDAIVLDGVDDATLARGVGHLPQTAYPGEKANVVIAGHRDSYFRGLHGIARGDAIRVVTPDGTSSHVVDRTLIVPPERVDVLAAGDSPRLTLVTCYPFHWIGPAPKRFIVQGHWVSIGLCPADGNTPPRAPTEVAGLV